MEHHASDESFDDGALGLSESLNLVSTSSVGNEDLALGGVDGDVILEANIIDLNFIIIVLSEKLEVTSVLVLGFFDLIGVHGDDLDPFFCYSIIFGSWFLRLDWRPWR